ncbi:MAG: hypothetical protein CL543_16760 [Alcanivorax sp.]|nr:hypothetical protein [Alcanivorax sp.]
MPSRRRFRRRWLWWPLVAVLLVAGAALLHTAWPFLTYPRETLTFQVPDPRPPEPLNQAVAGVAEVDITPAIGLPKFGYSAWAADGDGFRTRLKARAFYLHGPGGTPLALVQLDLGAGSLPLHYAVAQRIAATTDVPAHGLSLLVTHTHSGPAQYLGSDFYNVFGGNRPGFDPALFDFLANRIAEAVSRAYRDRRPARLAVGERDVWGLTRNRSPQAWARNHGIDPARVDGNLAKRAVNPRMTMLRLDLQADDGRFYPAGALTLFSIHGTAIPAFTGPYHADVWHWLARGPGAALERPLPWPFVHGAVQATHADNNPAWHPDHRGDREARRIGTALGAQAADLFQSLEGELAPRLVTAAASRQLDLLDLPEEQRHGLCERAVVGAATAGAANGDEVFPVSYLPYLQEGWPRRWLTDGCQGVKQWMLSKGQLLLSPEAFPHRALFQVMRVNDLVVVPLPWEVTLESGNRIRGAVLDSLPAGRPWRVEISSLANGFLGYAVTPEEYGAQYYEGGHTLYGPHTVDFLAAQSAGLAGDLGRRGEVDDLPAESRFSLLRHRYWPRTDADRTWARQWRQGARYHAAEGEKEAYWAWRFQGEPPGALDLSEPLLRVRGNDDRTLVADDQGGDLALRLIDQDDQGALYEVRWYRPPPAAPGSLELEVLAGDRAPSLTSPAFP